MFGNAYETLKDFLAGTGLRIVGVGSTDASQAGNVIVAIAGADGVLRDMQGVEYTAIVELSVFSRSRGDDTELLGRIDAVLEAVLGKAKDGYFVRRFPVGLSFETLEGGTRAARIQVELIWRTAIPAIETVLG